MTDHVTRVLREDELRAANTLFRATLHVGPPSDDEWDRLRPAYQPGRTLGVFDDALIGTARSLDAELTVTGGRAVPLAAVTGVGVRADRTRRGVLTELMRAQLADLTERGVVAATLHASEGLIYGRFGYGVATVARACTVRRRLARLRPEVPAGGEVELLGADDPLGSLRETYAALPRRAGMMSRPEPWWRGAEVYLRRGDEPLVAAVHHGTGGPDGFVLYRVSRTPGAPATLRVIDLHYADAEAFAGLWRFLLNVDLVDDIEVEERPVDEPVELLFTDPRACRVTAAGDEIWLRLVDVPAALATREWHGEPLVVEVDDPMLAGNTGRYHVGPGGARRTEEPPDLRLGVDALAMVYLGAWRPSALAHVGRAWLAGEDAAARADRLFGARTQAWCGTFF
ncbi:GNAT family N-acetyltransferase [Prauserella muralis]|uniref:Acetyltransferase n=1 Tax=Prauserella muralis TaxID=588067 RepID=A0A2V4APC0_9PSEU|nr:GNAT family N-acetyltransferase [Prauserella muralis]PXY22452.1 acetyltransferase [Prauserella muralis]TWE28126.1 putative acetyltransferase [Prauserella muralis]